MEPTTLIITNSFDMTIDRVIGQLDNETVFRFNRDLWQEYALSISPEGFRLVSPTGRTVERFQIAKCYWRVPLSKRALHCNSEPSVTDYIEREIDYVVTEIVNFLWRDRKVVLVEPKADLRIGKLLQLETGQRYFTIPRYEFRSGFEPSVPSNLERIVKSMSSTRVTDETYLWTTRVHENNLDPTLPWFVQDHVDATHDVTVVYIRGWMEGFSLERRNFQDQTTDWRELARITADQWKRHSIPLELKESIDHYMTDLGLHFGRLDFLYDGIMYWFLEVNSNGEWGWLDRKADGEILDKIVEEVRPDRPVHPIPVRWKRDSFQGADRVEHQ